MQASALWPAKGPMPGAFRATAYTRAYDLLAVQRIPEIRGDGAHVLGEFDGLKLHAVGIFVVPGRPILLEGDTPVRSTNQSQNGANQPPTFPSHQTSGARQKSVAGPLNADGNAADPQGAEVPSVRAAGSAAIRSKRKHEEKDKAVCGKAARRHNPGSEQPQDKSEA